MTDLPEPANEPSYTREECDLMALRFLAASGGDIMGPLESEEELAAALLYCDLKKRGLAHNESPEPGTVIWTITPAGERFLADAA